MSKFLVFAVATLTLFSANSVLAYYDASTSISVDTTWRKSNSPFVISTSIATLPGVTLTIEPGVVVKMGQPGCNCYSNITVNPGGTIIAGSSDASERVTFTSLHEDLGDDTDGSDTAPTLGDWRMITVNGTLELHHTDVRYGGYATYPGIFFNPDGVRMITNSGGTVLMDDADVSYAYSGAGYSTAFPGTTTVIHSHFHHLDTAIEQYQGTVTINDSVFASSSTGILTRGDGVLTIASSSLTTSIGINNQSPTAVTLARNNYWGSPTGPTNPANPSGTGAVITGNVLFDPWLDKAPSATPTPPLDPCIGVTNCYSNVLFLPGLEASRLYEQEGITDCSNLPPNSTPLAECLHEKQLWLPVTDRDTEKLYLNPDGTSIRSGIYTRDTIDEVSGAAVGTNIYKTFLLDLKQWKETDYIITDYSVVPYDWRLSVDDVLTKGVKTGDNISYGGANGTYVLDELLRMASTSRTKKVTIIAHSNGGLVAKRLMLKLRELGREDLVDKVVLIAVPQIGTPKAVGGLLHGTDLGLPLLLNEEHARTLGENMPSAYALLPSKKYFETIDIHSIPTELITFSNSTLYTKERAVYGSFVTNMSELHGYLLGSEGRAEPVDTDLDSPNVLKSGLLDQATTLHDSIDDWQPATSTQVIQIAGWGVSTISGVSYYTEQKQDCVTVPDQYFIGNSHQQCGLVYEVKKYNPRHTFEGDGTVVIPSALWMSTTTPHVERYWVDLKKYNKDNRIVTSFGLLPFDHPNILEVSTLLDFIKNKLTNSTSALPTYITNTSSTLSGTADVNYIYTLHSPLSLDLHDALGNHTGISTSTGRVEENIPGSRYGTFGEVKYIIANANVAQYLRLKGYATGTFSLDVEQVQGDKILASTTFASIPVSTTTIATFSLPANGVLSSSTPFSVDTDGNGTDDLNLAPQLGGVVYPDLVAPSTTASTAGTLGTNGWYTSNVLITLTATDTGSGVASTTYSLNNGSTWVTYAAPISVTAEGTFTILYRSTDKAGNAEATKILSLKIDRTAPEAQISVGTSTQDILVEATDNLGSTTITKDTSGNVTITDIAGHTTKLFFQKTFSGKILTYAKLTGIQYDNQTKITLPSSSFLYLWDTKAPIVPLSQTIAVDGTYLIQASYDKKANKTVVIVLKKNLPIQTQTFTGLRIVKLTTSKGVVGYTY